MPCSVVAACLIVLLFCMLLQNEMKDAHDALHACKKQAALVQDSLNVRTTILRGVVVALGRVIVTAHLPYMRIVGLKHMCVGSCASAAVSCVDSC
jgi:hypothetical protein